MQIKHTVVRCLKKNHMVKTCLSREECVITECIFKHFKALSCLHRMGHTSDISCKLVVLASKYIVYCYVHNSRMFFIRFYFIHFSRLNSISIILFWEDTGSASKNYQIFEILNHSRYSST